MLNDDQQAIADAITRVMISRRAPSRVTPKDPYADLAASYQEDTDGDAPRPGDQITPKTPTGPDTDANALSDSYRERLDEDFHGFHLDGDHRYE